MTTQQYKDLKGLHKENLRDNMSNSKTMKYLVIRMMVATHSQYQK